VHESLFFTFLLSIQLCPLIIILVRFFQFFVSLALHFLMQNYNFTFNCIR